MEGCSKRSAGAAPGLPDDLLVEILSRAPAKSVCRFKCVSKAWRDLIADPDHRKKLRQPMQGLFVQMPDESEADSDESEADDDGSEADDDEWVPKSFSFINLTGGSVPLDIDSCFSFLMEMTGIEAFLLDSCNGLILFGQRHDQSRLLDGYIVCNPTTRQWSAVPDCGSPVEYGHTYLAFNPAVSCRFHLVLFETDLFMNNIVFLHAYSSETGTWSKNQINEDKEQGQLEGWHHQFTLDYANRCTFISAFLHVVVYASDAKYILAVDIQGKAKRMITLPSIGRQEHDDIIFYRLGQSQGHLHCVILESRDEKISIWVLQDYDTQEWVLKKTMRALDVFGGRTEVTVFGVVDIHQDCNVVFFFHWRKCEVIAYNMDNKEVSVLATFEKPVYRSEFARYIPYFSESPALTNKYRLR